MVLDAAFVASTATSIMMNGVCCVWQMHEEEDRRDAIRRDIRVEYERQREMERELWEQRERTIYNANSQTAGSDHSYGAESRREKLVMEKSHLSSCSARKRDSEERDPSSPSLSDRRLQMRFPLHHPKRVPCHEMCCEQSIGTTGQQPTKMESYVIRPLQPSQSMDEYCTFHKSIQRSLMDDDEEDMEDDEEVNTEDNVVDSDNEEVTSLVDIALQ